ncbi:hypothetical protein HDU98_004109 [Podochytrium sp. JEL0797]|nr:hypothetical protein HDU98_004109 [Podochytrium sp. JEL0797]
MSNCLPLSSASLCGPTFVGWPVPLDPAGQLGFPSEAAFNSLIASVLSPNVATFTDADRGCTPSAGLTADVQAMRYQASFSCAAAVQSALAQGCTPSGTNSTFNADPGSVVLCHDVCQQALATYQNVYANNKCVVSPSLQSKLTLRNNVCNSSTSTTTTAKQCSLGVAPELTACGFVNAAQSLAYCANPVTSSDACCTYPAGAQFQTLGSDGQFHLPTPPPASSSGPSTGAIAGGAIGGILAIALIAGGVFVYMKRSKSQSNLHIANRFDNDNAYKHELEPTTTFNTNTVPAYPPPARQQQQQQLSTNASLNTSKPQQQPPVMIPQQQLQQKQGGEIVRIIHTYESQLPDELNLVEGDDLILVKRFDDGYLWAQGVNPLTGKQGAFPLVCVCTLSELNTAKPAEQKRQANANRISKRMSSMSTTSLGSPAPAPHPPSPSTSGSGNGRKQNTLRILFPYKATQGDELDLVVGNDIIVLKSFDDGWALGMQPLTGQKGAFPLACVGKPEDTNRASQMSMEAAKRLSKRVSSLLSWQE